MTSAGFRWQLQILSRGQEIWCGWTRKFLLKIYNQNIMKWEGAFSHLPVMFSAGFCCFLQGSCSRITWVGLGDKALNTWLLVWNYASRQLRKIWTEFVLTLCWQSLIIFIVSSEAAMVATAARAEMGAIAATVATAVMTATGATGARTELVWFWRGMSMEGTKIPWW